MATTFYLLDTASDINPTADTEKLLSLTAGSAAVTAVTNTAAGPFANAGPQVTATAGGTAIRWLSNPLSAVTISVAVANGVALWGLESNAMANVAWFITLNRVDGSGTFISEIQGAAGGTGQFGTELGTASGETTRNTSPTSTTLADGDRLELIVYISDPIGITMASGHTATLRYAGAPSTDHSRITFSETITEYTPPAPADASKPWRRTAHVPGQRYVTPGTVFGRSWIKKYSGVMVPSYGS